MWNQRGPLCRYLNVTPNVLSYCEDKCETPGWRVMEAENIALEKEIAMFRNGEKTDIDASRLVDEYDSTSLNIPNTADSIYYKINLGKMYRLCQMTIAWYTDFATFTYDVDVSKTGEI